jgi:hypothetical protein
MCLKPVQKRYISDFWLVATSLMSWDRTLAVTIRLTSSSKAEKEGVVVTRPEDAGKEGGVVRRPEDEGKVGDVVPRPEDGRKDGAGVPAADS